jgi:hypothetical protein
MCLNCAENDDVVKIFGNKAFKTKTMEIYIFEMSVHYGLCLKKKNILDPVE